MFAKNRLNVAFLGAVALFAALSLSGCDSEQAKGKGKAVAESAWVLRDSIGANLTGFDPIQIVDATTLNVLANCYEGLVVYDQKGNIIPGLAERWETSADRLVWTFHLKPNVRFQPWGDLPGFKHSGILTAEDVVYSLVRCMTAPTSFNTWWLGDIVARNADGSPAINAVDPLTVTIRLQRPYALLHRLVSVAGWVYPAGMDKALGAGGLANKVVGTGPYRLDRFVPDDQIVLSRWDGYAGAPAAAPAQVVIKIISDQLAAFASYRAGALDAIKLDLDIIDAGRDYAKKQGDSLITVAANQLDYLCMNMAMPPFDDPDLRAALAFSLDREKLASLFKGAARPAHGFLSPGDKGYMGDAALRQSGFRYDPEKAKRHFQAFLARTGAKTPLRLKLAYDGGMMPELAAQFYKNSAESTLPIAIQLEKMTWPELAQGSFNGTLAFHRMWWLIATPSEDVPFQFYMPGKNPPAGMNLSRYNNPAFAQRYLEVFSSESEQDQLAGARALEQTLIDDAVAIPLWHDQPVFMLRQGIHLPIAATLRKFYAASTRAAD